MSINGLNTYQSIGSMAKTVETNAKNIENPGPKEFGTSFASSMENALQSVADTQHKASEMTKAYELGIETDIAKVMIARQKSSVAFTATTQVRNKLLEAYKQVMSMPV